MAIQVSKECYTEIEAWLEEIYEQYPFRRIYENGKPLGYRGFLNNFYLEAEEVIPGAIEVRVLTVESGKAMFREAFDRTTGQVYSNGEVQGSLL